MLTPLQTLLVVVLLASNAAAIISHLSAPAAPAKCIDGYTFDSMGGKCYQRYRSPTSHRSAQATCSNDGAHLAHVHNAKENSNLAGNLTDGDMWLGLQCNGSSVASCFWDDDGTDASSYSNFLRDLDVSVGGCVMIYGDTGKWASSECEYNRMYYTCEYDPSLPRCDDDWKYVNGSCFQVLGDGHGFYHSEAEPYCSSHSSRLASIHSREENDAILDLAYGTVGAGNSNVWIGLRRVGATPTFEWSDGSEWDYENWANGQPDNATGSMWGYMSNGGWISAHDQPIYLVACQKPYKK